jgi:glycyl-tRNA synthetase beta chain
MPEGITAFATPRRLALVATGLPIRQPDRREEKKGPRVGAPERAVAGFLKSAGLSSLDQCEQREDKKGAYYVAVIDQKGKDTADLIASMTPEIVAKFSWPKSMRWGDRDLRWVRPLHSVLCAFNGEIVDFDIGGIQSGDKTAGHRFMAPDEIQVRNFNDYVSRLRAAKVILDTDERKEIIARDAATLCKAQGFELVNDAGLLNEVAGLAEWPVAMMGSFDEKFLALPDEVLTASMRGHQKYFSVRNPKTGGLANRFICVANMEAPDGGKAMREGYERVLTARLSDGWYLYNQDLKTRLEDRINDLDRVTFFEGLGSVGDKARRVAALAKEIAPAVGADPDVAERAALLAKADLVSLMVNEFPELQGVMGRYYYLAESGLGSLPPSFEARPNGLTPQDEGSVGRQGGSTKNPHPEEPSRSEGVAKDGKKAPTEQQIADAIRDHYKPSGADDAVPTAPVSVAVALADKIDTLTAFWAIDKKPTGSSDPFALRRAALGVIKLVLMNDVHLSLTWVVDSGIRQLALHGGDMKGAEEFSRAHQESMSRDIAENDGSIKLALQKDHLEFYACLPDTLFDFILDRLEVHIRDHGHQYDVFNAVKKLEDRDWLVIDDVVLIINRLTALEAFLKTDDGANLAAAYKRAANILKPVREGAQTEPVREGAQTEPVREGAQIKNTVFNPELMVEPEEKAFFTALEDAEAKAKKAVEAEDFEAAMMALAALRAPVDQFFEHVKVNDDDPAIRANRLALLMRFRAATASVADFSKLEG